MRFCVVSFNVSLRLSCSPTFNVNKYFFFFYILRSRISKLAKHDRLLVDLAIRQK